MPCGLSSNRSESVSAFSAPFVAEYAPLYGGASRPTTEETMAMAPRRRCFMCGTTAWMQLTAPKKFTSNTRRMFSRLPSTTVALSPSPALFTSTSMEPSSATVRSTIANTASRSLTSVGTTSRRPGRPSSSPASASSAPRLRDDRTTLLPARANRTAAALPMPLDAPVTMTVLPFSSTGGLLPLCTTYGLLVCSARSGGCKTSHDQTVQGPQGHPRYPPAGPALLGPRLAGVRPRLRPLRLPAHRDARVRGGFAVHARRRRGDGHRPEGDVRLPGPRRPGARPASGGHGARLPRLPGARHAQPAPAGPPLVLVPHLPLRPSPGRPLSPAHAARLRGDRRGGRSGRRGGYRAPLPPVRGAWPDGADAPPQQHRRRRLPARLPGRPPRLLRRQAQAGLQRLRGPLRAQPAAAAGLQAGALPARDRRRAALQ